MKTVQERLLCTPMVPLMLLCMLAQAFKQLEELLALHDLAINGYVGLALQSKGIMKPLIQRPEDHKHQYGSNRTDCRQCL